MGYLDREARRLPDAKLYEMILDGAERVLGGQGRETASDSMDCDYGHELIEAAINEYQRRAKEN